MKNNSRVKKLWKEKSKVNLKLNTNMSKACLQDRDQLFEIWEKCFGDSKEYIAFSLDANFDRFFVYKLEGKAVSMLCVIPCMYGNAKGGYVYAVATLPEHQGKGYSKKLLTYAEMQMIKKGYGFSCLVPAGEQLFNFYSSQGYKTAFYCSKYSKSFQQKEKTPLQMDVEKIGVDEFLKLKELYKKPNHIVWSREHLEFLYRENEFLGGEVLKINANGEQGVVVVAIGEDAVFIKDIMSCSQTEDFAKLVSQKYEKKCFLRAEPEKDNKLPFGMVKNFKENIKIFDGYISLVLD